MIQGNWLVMCDVIVVVFDVGYDGVLFLYGIDILVYSVVVLFFLFFDLLVLVLLIGFMLLVGVLGSDVWDNLVGVLCVFQEGYVCGVQVYFNDVLLYGV